MKHTTYFTIMLLCIIVLGITSGYNYLRAKNAENLLEYYLKNEVGNN